MARYICPTCGEKFNRPDRAKYKGEEWSCCPECGNLDYEPADHCACCGEDFCAHDLIGGLCEECLNGEATMEDYWGFAHDAQMREAFAEYMVEVHGTTWRERQLKPFRRDIR